MIDIWEILRPSGLPAAELCPGNPLMQVRAINLCPELLRIEHPAARQGTLGHEVVAQTVSLIYHGPDGWLEPEVALAKMESVMSGLEEWTRDAARRCVTYAVALVDREIRAGYSVEIHIEVKLSGRCINIPRGGTADIVIVCRDDSGKVRRLVIQDHKLGWLDQGHACEHLQLAAYAVMGWDRWQPTDKVEIHLAQGRRRDFTAAEFDEAATGRARQRIIEAVARATDPAPELRPSIDACRYCKALPLCGAAREVIMTAVEEHALFGADPDNRVKLANDAAMARRFAEEAGLLAKEWVREGQSV